MAKARTSFFCRVNCKCATDDKELTKLIKALSSQALHVGSECEFAVDEGRKHVDVMDTGTSTPH